MTAGIEIPVNCNSLTPWLTASQIQGSTLSLVICLYLNLLGHLQFCFWTWPDLPGSVLISSLRSSRASDRPRAWPSRDAQRRSVTDSTSPLKRYWFAVFFFFLRITIKYSSCGSKIANIPPSLVKKYLLLMVSQVSMI